MVDPAAAGSVDDHSHTSRMFVVRLVHMPVVIPLVVVSALLFGCTNQERADTSWRTVHLTAERQAQIDPATIAIHSADDQREVLRARLVAAGFTLRDGLILEVVRADDTQAGYARDLERLADLVTAGDVRLILIDGTQRCEAGDAVMIKPQQAGHVPAILERHHLQNVTVVVDTTIRVETKPRGDLLHLDQRLAELRADPEVVYAELDLITLSTLKSVTK